MGQRVGGIHRPGDVVVGLAGDEPTAWAQCRGHAPQSVSRIMQVHEEKPAVNEVLGRGLNIIDGDVAPTHLDVGLA